MTNKRWVKKLLHNEIRFLDGFAFAIKGMRSIPRKSKTVVEEIATKGEARLAISVTRAAEQAA